MVTINPEDQVVSFARTNFRNMEKKFGIKVDDRRRHMYLIGKTGMGKTTVIENMVISDIKAGRGLALVDPHGDLIEKVIQYIPSYRVNDVVYFNPADTDNPIGFNVLESVDESQRHLVASGLMGVFTKIWEGVWSARMEYILNNAILALLEYPGSTMLGISRILVDKKFRNKVIDKVTDPVVKAFWKEEYAGYNERFRNEAIAPIQNKVGQFLSSSVIRNIVGQPKSTIDLRDLMDSEKILLFNLSKGRVGEDNSALLGAMMITRIQLAAMSRVNIEEKDRKDFYLYVDEFQNFATESFASVLSEARKYRLNLIIAHQYIEQLDETVRAAVFGNVGTIICFRVGAGDSEFLAKEFFPVFLEEDLINLTKYNVYLKLMIDGVSSEPFSAITLPPIEGRTNNRDKVISVSRERYSKPKELVEEKILRWSGVNDTIKLSENTAPKKDYSTNKPPYKKPVSNSYTPNRSKTPYVKKTESKRPESEKPELEKKPFQKKPFREPIKNLESVKIDNQDKTISLKEALSGKTNKFSGRNNKSQQKDRPQFNKQTRPNQINSTNSSQSLKKGQVVNFNKK
ncbi:MAG: type IV secretory system conjugative DNA transfer family protein [Candidatus Kerfeldbacteria bacterium]